MGVSLYSCDDTLAACSIGLGEITEWFRTIRADRFKWWIGQEERNRRREEKVTKLREIRDTLVAGFEEFRNVKRFVFFNHPVVEKEG